MTLVDTSVWIDHFNGVLTAEVALLADCLRRPSTVLVGDIVLLELLQGVPSPREARVLERTLLALPTVSLLDVALARQAAGHYRILRASGVTPRKTSDLIIAAYCIANGHELLHCDRDFTQMSRFIALRTLSPSLH